MTPLTKPERRETATVVRGLARIAEPHPSFIVQRGNRRRAGVSVDSGLVLSNHAKSPQNRNSPDAPHELW
jgi:hypothetical protein